MTETIYKPRCLREFKEIVTRNNDFNAKMTLRWNDLIPEAKEKLALSIKNNSRSWTVRCHPKATPEAINATFTEINPILDQTRTSSYRTVTWSFGAGQIASAGWLEKLSTIIVIALKLRRLSKDRFADFFLGVGGWGAYQIAHDFKDRTINELNLNSDSNQINVSEQPEISLEEVSHASQRAISNRINH